MGAFGDVYARKRVLVTGHTGFKGSWLTIWLRRLGAKVLGYSLDPPTSPNLFELARVAEGIEDHRQDVRDSGTLERVVASSKPDAVMHLAAQAIVRESYETPLETLSTNVMGTAQLIEAVRRSGHPCAVVIVTSDKCYENLNWQYGYRETDPIGGSDPYSMSKGCAELVVTSWRRSFLGNGSSVRLASARAGNVIGGGDWGRDRIMTDCIGALCAGKPIGVRNPSATRPWQHVLEPLGGYLWLGAKLLGADGHRYAQAWNFGPPIQSVCTARELVELVIGMWGDGRWEDLSDPAAPHEAHLLALNWEKAFHHLEWEPTWMLRECVRETVRWYRAWNEGHAELRALCEEQIEEYTRCALQRRVTWALGGD